MSTLPIFTMNVYRGNARVPVPTVRHDGNILGTPSMDGIVVGPESQQCITISCGMQMHARVKYDARKSPKFFANDRTKIMLFC
jgi:hypothetical protein